MTRLRFALERLVLRLVMGLPPGVQRLLRGRPRRLDGLELAPELQLMFAAQRLARIADMSTLPIDDARLSYRRLTRMIGGRPPLAAYRDLQVDGGAGPLDARLYTPTACIGAETSPTLLFLHGGGWMYGDLETHDPFCRVLAETAGVQVLAVDYRRTPEHRFPAASDDCKAAYRWLVEHAEEVGADRDRLAVGGDSAGGALSASTAVFAAEEELPMRLQLLIYPGTDWVEESTSRRLFAPEGLLLTQAFLDGARENFFDPDAVDVHHPDASALRRTDFPADLAPAHVVTAGFDPLRDEGEAYAALLEKQGVEVDLTRYASMVHGFIHFVDAGRECPAYVREIAERAGAVLRA
ncbi:alpha/beta hydrolase [Nocardioides aurantiacus]|uniref:Acetyl esterase n=1 Tax=Nocardioides aurantiacus TaxID=86796 RepID=A0A3N2CYD9_9ACTN|nr:alpha/beta hydrolase [Nocardioides aurantiacus]ROR92565.1 acetyl esterase [Nocardioides aurantiacus]